MAGFSSHWALAFGLLGNVVSFMVFLSPIPTFYQIYKKKSSEGFQSVPYVVALFSCMLWIFYAFLKSNTTLLITINSVGLFIETIYISFYLFYAPRKSRVQTIKLLVLLIVCGFGCIVLSTIYLVKPSQQAMVVERIPSHLKVRTCREVVGWICLVFSLCVFIAPLCILRRVIQTKSVEYMPVLLSFFLTLSAVMWFFYGLLIKDFVVAVPNVLGFSFGVVQMLLYMKYKNGAAGKNMNIINHDQKLPADVEKQVEEQIVEIVKLSDKSAVDSHDHISIEVSHDS